MCDFYAKFGTKNAYVGMWYCQNFNPTQTTQNKTNIRTMAERVARCRKRRIDRMIEDAQDAETATVQHEQDTERARQYRRRLHERRVVEHEGNEEAETATIQHEQHAERERQYRQRQHEGRQQDEQHAERERQYQRRRQQQRHQQDEDELISLHDNWEISEEDFFGNGMRSIRKPNFLRDLKMMHSRPYYYGI